MSKGPFLRKYGVETTLNFDLFEVDGVDFRVDAAHAAGDTKIMKDEGAEANTTNGFTDEGQGYSIVLTATEMQAARIKVYIVDAATKAWLDTSITIETYGNASAMHAMDFDDAVRGGLTALPNAAAEAAGGLATSTGGATGIDDLALASVVGALNDAAAAGDPTSADTLMQYIKQLINVLVGAAGVGTFPAEAAPGNAVSLAEVIRAIHTDVTGLNGDAMRGTDSAATAAALATAQLDLDIITGADGALIATDGLDAAALSADAGTEIGAAVRAAIVDKIQKNTAFNNFMFKMVDADDLKTAETGLTPTCTRSLDGAAFGACANAAVEVSNGWYKINLAQGDVNADVVVLRFTDALAADREFMIVTNPVT